MPMRPPFARRPWLALLLLSPSLALADTPAQLPDVEVTATAAQEPLPTTTSTDAGTLDKRFIRSFDDLSRRGEPGVNYNRNDKSINIRGLDGNRVKTSIDGIRQPFLNDNIWGTAGGLDSIDFQSLSSIDVVRGANSSQAGSGALGGALRLRTLDPEDLLGKNKDFGSLVKSDYDSAEDSWGLNAALAGRLHDTSWLLQLGHRRGHELENQGSADLLGTLRSEANPRDTRQDSLLLKLQQQFGEHRLGLTGEYFDNHQDIDARSGRNATYPNHYDTAESNERKRLSVEHQYRAAATDGLLDWADSVLYWQKSQRENEVRATRATAPIGGYGRNNQIEKTQYGLNSSAGKQLGRHNLSVGGELSRITTEQYSAGYDGCPNPLLPPPATDMATYRACTNLHTNAANMPKTPGTAYAFYLKDDIGLSDSLTLTPGIRYDRYAYKPKSTSGFEQNDNTRLIKDNKDAKWSGSLLLTWQAHELATLYAQWAQGFRAPDPDELYSTLVNYGSRYVRIGDPNLKPEESTGYEVGARLGNETLGGSISLFDNYYKNFIDDISGNAADYGFDPAQISLVMGTGNRDKVRIHGAEATAHWAFARDWKLWSSISWAEGEDRTTDQYINSVAPLRGAFGLSYDRQNHGAELILSAAKQRDKVQSDDYFKAPGYGVVDLTGYWQPAALEGVKLQAGVFNLFDKKYWTALDIPLTSIRTPRQPDDYYSEAGRSFRVAASWQF